MARSISFKVQEEGPTTFRKALVPARQYLLKRVGAIYPYLLISTLISMLVRIASGEWSLFKSLYNMILMPSDLMLLQNYGIRTTSFTGVVWYLCASFFAMAMLYPVMRVHYDGYNRYYAPIVSLLLMGLVQYNYGLVGEPNKFFLQVFNTGFIRSIAMVSLGGFIYELSVWLGKISFSKSGLCLLTVLEIVLYMGVFAYMAVWRQEYASADSLVVLFLGFAIALTLSGKSCLYGKVDCKPVLFLGKFSMVLYFNHFCWFFAAKNIFGSQTIGGLSVTVKLVAICLSFLTSLLVYALGSRLSAVGTKLLKRFIVDEG